MSQIQILRMDVARQPKPKLRMDVVREPTHYLGATLILSYVVLLCVGEPTTVQTGTRLTKNITWRTGAQLAEALSDQSVVLAELEADVVLLDSDFTGRKLPIVVSRNFTIQGHDEQPTLNFNYIYNKVRLAAGVVLTIRNVVAVNVRAKSLSLTPGLDLLVSMLPGETALLVFANGTILSDFCYPLMPSQSGSILSYTARPPGFEGTQRGVRNVSQLGCINDTSTPLRSRCWPARGIWNDVALIAYDLKPGLEFDNLTIDNVENLQATNYYVHYIEEAYLCKQVQSVECMQTYGVLGCAWQAAKDLPPAKPYPAATVPPALSGGTPHRVVVPIVAGIVGGVVGLGAILAAFLLYRVVAQRRKRLPEVVRMTKRDEDVDVTKGSGESKATLSTDGGIRQPVVMDTDSSIAKAYGTAAAVLPKQALSTGLPSAAKRPLSSPTVLSPLTPHRPDLNLSLRFGVPAENVADLTDMHLVREPSCNGGKAAAAPSRTNSGAGPQGSTELRLLGEVLGRGCSAKVVLGEYCGQRVAVKMLQLGVLLPFEVRWPQHMPQAGQQEAADQHPHDLQQQQQQADAEKAAGGDADLHQAEMEALLRAYRQEIEVLGRCQHPNVVRLLAACTEPPRLCLVMELAETNLARLLYDPPNLTPGPQHLHSAHGFEATSCDGAGFSDATSMHGSTRLLPLPTVLNIALDIARGLEYLHPTIVHRDLKPANVLVNAAHTGKPEAKLADFGLSRLRSTVHPTIDPEVGTPPYMAPECFEVHNYVVTHHADIYSWAVLMYEMLSGKLPWGNISITEIAYNVTLQGNRPPLASVPPERCPRKLRNLIIQCWDAAPERRPAAAEVVKQLLLIQQMLSQQPGPAAGIDSSCQEAEGVQSCSTPYMEAGAAAAGSAAFSSP